MREVRKARLAVIPVMLLAKCEPVYTMRICPQGPAARLEVQAGREVGRLEPARREGGHAGLRDEPAGLPGRDGGWAGDPPWAVPEHATANTPNPPCTP